MSENLKRYREAFAQAFEISLQEVEQAALQKTEKWDSMGHMMLIAALEEAFSIEFEPEEMLALDSFAKGMELLKEKGVAL